MKKLLNKHAKIIVLAEDTPQPESQKNKIEEFNDRKRSVPLFQREGLNAYK